VRFRENPARPKKLSKMECSKMNKMKPKNRVDPRLILEEIASDPDAPAVARVSAARALLKLDATPPGGDIVDSLTKRALEKMGRRDG
jgi:hypothetical protein